jgi:hypothetical protein
MTRQLFTCLTLFLWVVACAPAVPVPASVPPAEPTAPETSAPASPAPSTPAASPSSATTIVLREAPAGMGCDAIGVDYTSLTFRVDPAATEQVSAVTDTGVTLATYWAAGFLPGNDSELLVRDPAGEVVVAHGDTLSVPSGTYPRLQGYFVCLAPDRLYVLLADPT